MDKITQINVVLKEYFTLNKTVRVVPAKDMMPYFILAGIFPSDYNNGRPIRALLRKLDADNKLRRIPFAVAERKIKNTSWFFRRKG
jgi:DNA polymerase II large subunit